MSAIDAVSIGALTVASAALIGAGWWDMTRILPRQIQARRVVEAAEQLCWDEEFRRIERSEDEP